MPSFFDTLFQLLFDSSLKVIFIPLVSSFFVICFLTFYRYIFPKKNIPPVLLLVLLSLPAILNLFRPGTYQSGDLSYHTEYLRAFFGNIGSGIFIPQWAADFCAGNGCPIFIFAYVLPYYIGSFFHIIGFSFLDSVKIVLAIAFIGSGLTMYFFVKEEFGKIAGLISAIFYLFSPYHLIDTHFRGSVGEVLSYLFIPLLFLFSKKLITTGNMKYFLLNGLVCIFILFSHASTTFSIIPLLLAYNFITLKRINKKIFSKSLVILLSSYLFALLLSAYYWLPAFAENKYSWHARYGSVGYYEPIQNYLFSPAGYGFLFQGNRGEFRLIIGYMHLLVALIAALLLFIKKQSFFGKDRSLLVGLLMFFLGYFLMMQTFAKPIWDNV